MDSTTMPALAPDSEPLPRATETEHQRANTSSWRTFARRFLALAIVVVVINLCWQFFRAWMPKMLEDQYHYSSRRVQYFSICYYIAADVGCLTIGFLTKWLAGRGFLVHQARILTFLACTLLTALTTVAAMLPASSLFLAVLLVIGFGSLGLFPTYYAFTQELSARRMGNVTGILSFITWMAHASVQEPIGRWIDRTGSFSQVMFVAGLTPLLGLLAMLTLWNGPARRPGRELGGNPR